MNIPTVQECLALMKRYEMLENIRQHSFVVARVAEALVNGLSASTHPEVKPPRLDQVIAGALLHDIAKTKCIYEGCVHAEEGQIILEMHGYREIGAIVAEHVLLSTFTIEQYRQGSFPAREIVYYADKRVRHDAIVSLQERLEYIIDRYAGDSGLKENLIRENFSKCLELEQYLFSFLDFEPDDLTSKIDGKPF